MPIPLQVNTVVPEWALQMVVAFGAVVFFISLVGIIGTYKSPEYIVREKCNFWLLIYQVLILACLVITIVAAVAFLSLLQTVDSAKSTQPQGSGASFEEKIKNWGRNNPSEWTDIQNMLKCCGYNDAHDPTLATGDACPRNATNTRTLCKTLLLNQIEDKSKIIGIVAVVVAFVELLTLVASCCVIWTKPVAEPRVSLAEQSYT